MSGPVGSSVGHTQQGEDPQQIDIADPFGGGFDHFGILDVAAGRGLRQQQVMANRTCDELDRSRTKPHTRQHRFCQRTSRL